MQFDITADFDVRDAVGELERLGLATRTEGRLTAIAIDDALVRSEALWTGLADAEQPD